MGSAVLEREPVVAREDERPAIERIEDLIDRGFERGTHHVWLTVSLTGPSGPVTVELPDTVVRLVVRIVRVLAQGEAVSIVPVHKELTTQEAADLLNVSRQYLIRLLERGEIPYSKTGTHRRIKFGDLMEYKRRRDQERRKGLAELTRASQELGLYQ